MPRCQSPDEYRTQPAIQENRPPQTDSPGSGRCSPPRSGKPGIPRSIATCSITLDTTQPRVVAAFLAFDGEPDLAPALMRNWSAGACAWPCRSFETRPAVPTCVSGNGRRRSEMKPNRYGIPEPVGTLDVRLSEIDLVLIPLVAWDAQGGRLGMGASFYDRSFQPLPTRRQPFRLGVAYQLQQVERLPLDPWDIRLHGMLTENGCFNCPF